MNQKKTTYDPRQYKEQNYWQLRIDIAGRLRGYAERTHLPQDILNIKIEQLDNAIEYLHRAESIERENIVLDWLQSEYGRYFREGDREVINEFREERDKHLNMKPQEVMDGFLIADGWGMDEEIKMKKILDLLNERVFIEPVTFDDFIWLLFGEPVKAKVSDIPSITIVMETLANKGIIYSNWRVIAEFNNSFVSKNGTTIKALNYRQALKQWREQEKKYRTDKEPNKTYVTKRELEKDLIKILNH